MTSVNVSLRKEVYDFLKSKRMKGESFSDVIVSLKEGKKSPMDFWGVWKDKPKEEIEEIRKRLTETRKELNESWSKRLK